MPAYVPWLVLAAIVANVDASGRFASLMPGARGLGQFVGPNLAALILADAP